MRTLEVSPSLSDRVYRAKQTQQRQRDAAIRSAYEAGETLREVGQRFGLSFERVRQILVRDGVEIRSWCLPDDVRDEIVRLGKRGVLVAHIAQQVGVAQHTVANVLDARNIKRERQPLGKLWRPVDDALLLSGYERHGAAWVAQKTGRTRSSVIGRWHRLHKVKKA